MHVLALFALMAAGVAAADQPPPAELQVTEVGGFLSYKVVNLSPYTITGYDVSTWYKSGGFENLGCTISATVKSPKDLVIRNGCGLPVDSTTGKPVAYSSRLVTVHYENGITWKPGESSASEKR
jgi:hypothetical protein